MKLSIISEVANPELTNMDGVEVNSHGADITYSFKDPNFPDLSYNVVFEAIEPQSYCPHYRDIRRVVDENSYGIDLRVMHKDSPFWTFEKTGKGNFGFVYGKLMACVIDFFLTKNIEAPFVMFSGYTKDMERIYKRIMNRLNDEYPAFAYYPYNDDLYISAQAIEKLEDENVKNEIFDMIKSNSKQKDAKLELYRKMKREKTPHNRGNIY